MNETIQTNPLIDRLPPHLKQFIKPQNYDDYTAINQAVWRYVMRKNVEYLGKVAHESYLSGLKKTGISINEIPSMYGMNRILKDIGWAAVAVDGFIPPNAFMEFQAYKVLVIASDIRQLENIEYTPAPDIIHEGAGHAPIIASPDYAEYLRRFGEIGSKAISSAHDIEMYEAVRAVSILKEAEGTPQEQIDAAEALVEELQNKKVEPSEISLIRNLHWWTVEYGLVGTVEDPKIYGAGLLSSIGESKNCMTDAVKKIPYSIDAAYQDFDITKQQPQLFVTPDFAYLQEVLEEFANTMAVRKGGWRGLKKLIESKQLGTIELSTGLQVSGVFKRMIQNEDNEVVYFETEGETALSYREKELIGHGIERHINGFRSPLGKLKGINLAIENMGPRDLQAYNFYDGKHIQFEFESGITVEGMNVTGIRNLKSELMLIQFTDCTVKYKDEVLFSPEDGDFDFAVGKDIVSAFAGMADYRSFNVNTHNPSTTTTIKTERSAKQKELIELYEAIRNYRNGETTKFSPDAVFDILKKHHNEDWLLPLEIYELEVERNTTLSKEVFRYLNELKERRPEVSHLIEGGLELLETPEHV
ncbi:aromatic amino acid hydroxylase [Croceibacter atlanticus]|jgi:phenylalanine-4-hydroxylase|uniref:Phenylalanine 4-monooxygenase (Phenylalanine-4-hydroxylase) n=1 Tax=Croceibacter atlanticus (strain ATCC BAA-628 / JCM 21780 / CIP 108009 / IAM 15332 / KCTC 12090 / HTCC2559) TaxID=216432 RepID=A3U7E2_CROAH|nr:aromatic amino acid hydroxylase [Croceibacter atlanticus]EAP88159.1 phenylalanine 4-monooxygenase (phenylalanine-4-hydroxylase) [Croceibacter atlanticus HTCC2559]MBW4971529.1 aromatic amino acid hydroxylase [Croceibacter atlanticus]